MEKLQNLINNSFRKSIIESLKKGGIVVLPTDTAYALCVDSENQKAVKKIYKIKKRVLSNPLPVFVSSLKMANKYCEIDKKTNKFLQVFWPGPLTIVVSKKEKKLSFVSNKESVGIRMPANKDLLEIIEKFSKPITGTSANISGEKECYSIKSLLKQIPKEEIDLIFDNGELPSKKVSTIIKFENNKIIILREGAIKKKELEEVWKSLKG